MTFSFSKFFDILRVILCLGTKTKTEEWIEKDENPPEKICEGPRIDYTKRLPRSVLGKIFLRHVEICVHPSSPFVEPDPTAPPLVVSQVNSLWRRTALETPQLWSSIRIGNRVHTEIVDLWIKRSGRLEHVPLDIHIDAIHTVEDLAGENYSPARFNSSARNGLKYRTTRLGRAWCILRTQFRRWRRVEFVLDVQSACYFLELPLVWMKRLERLSVEVVADDVYDAPARILNSIDTYMNPSVILKWDSTPLVGAVRHQAWQGLRKIHLTMGLTMDQGISFLRRCTQAQEVTLGCITDVEVSVGNTDALPGSTHSRYRLPNLKDLTIGSDGSACDCTLIVHFFALPALRRLRFHNFRTTLDSCMRILDLLEFSEAENDDEENGWSFRELSIVDHYMPEMVLQKLLSMPELGPSRVPAVSYYTRRTVRLEYLMPILEIVGDVTGLAHYQDARGGTWIGRMGLPDTYLLV